MCILHKPSVPVFISSLVVFTAIDCVELSLRDVLSTSSTDNVVTSCDNCVFRTHTSMTETPTTLRLQNKDTKREVLQNQKKSEPKARAHRAKNDKLSYKTLARKACRVLHASHASFTEAHENFLYFTIFSWCHKLMVPQASSFMK